jgi:hypothetical protein
MRRRHVRADLEGVLGGVGVTERQRRRGGGSACDGRETATRDAIGHVCLLHFHWLDQLGLLASSGWWGGKGGECERDARDEVALVHEPPFG